MNKVKELFLKFKWHLLGVAALIIFFIVRSFGKSTKQEEYTKVVTEFFQERRQDIAQKLDVLSDSIVKEEEKKVERAEAEVANLEKDLQERITVKTQAININSAETAARLKQMGLR